MQALYQAIPLLDTRRKIYSASSVISSFPAPAILCVLQHSPYHNCCKKPSSGTLQSASFLPDQVTPESTVLYGVTSADVEFVCFSHVQRSVDCQGFRMALELLHMSVTYLQKANLSIFHDNK